MTTEFCRLFLKDLKLSEEALVAIKEHSGAAGSAFWGDEPEQFRFHAECIMAIVFCENPQKPQWNPKRVPWKAFDMYRPNGLIPESEIFYLRN